MTQDYKDTLLRYLTGNLNIETGSNEPQFSETQTKSSDINDYINHQITGSWSVIDIIQGYQSIYSVVYGNTSTNGFLVILDENMNPIQFIDSYVSGTKFGLFQILRVDEEGKFFGIDINNGTPRFIMLNNIVLKLPTVSEFSVNLRRSYNLPSPLSTASKYFEIIKSVGQARYLIGATIMQSGDPYQLATELVINVGAENEWNNYQDTTSTFEGQCMWASWNENVLSFKIGGYVAGSSPFYVEYQRWNGTTGKWSMEIPTPSGYEQGNYSINTVILNSSTAYVSIFSSGVYGEDENMSIYKIDYTEEDVDLVKTISGSNLITQSPNNRVKFKIKNGIVFFLFKQYRKYSNVNNTYVYAGIILGMNAYYSYGLSENGDIDNYYLCIANLFNLYNYYMIGLDSGAGARGGNDFFIQQLYNPSNYNGIAYEDINSLCPNSAVLYDNSNNIAFARNLYNVSHYGNTTLSVVQIPNTQVNDISLTPKLLIGKTNKILVNDEESFVKNIYETVYLNFYNQLVIENRNQVPYTQNEPASNILNASTSYAFDYSATKATKYKINYIDGTSEIHNIQPNISNGIATYNLRVVVPYDNLITNLQIISEDQTTVYQTISLLSLESGKIYNITQDCYVE